MTCHKTKNKMKIKEMEKTVELSIERGIATEMADRLEKMGIDVEEVQIPVKTKAKIIINKPDNADDFAAMLEAASHSILTEMFEEFKEE